MISHELEEGDRVGRFVILRDRDGWFHAVAAGAVSAVCEIEDGGVLMQVSGRLIHVERPLTTVLGWLDGRSQG